jgi:general secretion pathway protein F
VSKQKDTHRPIGNGPPLSNKDTAELAERLAELVATNTPLAEGLRAAAEETGSRRLRKMLARVAARLEAGEPIEEVLLSGSVGLPAHVAGMVRAGLGCGQLSQVLTELVERYRTHRELRRNILLALAYPAFLVIAIAAVYMLAFTVILPPIVQLVEEMEVELPALTQAIVLLTKGAQAAVQWLVSLGKPMFGATGKVVTAIVVATLGIAYWWFRRRPAFEHFRARWHWLLGTMPLFGPLRVGISITDFSRLLRVLLEQQVPLPDALRLTADGVSDANVAEVSRTLAQGTAAGQPLSDLLAATSRMPALMVPLVRWGEQADRLPEALAAIGETAEGRVRLGTAMLVTVFPPIAFVFLGAAVLGLMAVIFLPLYSVINMTLLW